MHGAGHANRRSGGSLVVFVVDRCSAVRPATAGVCPTACGRCSATSGDCCSARGGGHAPCSDDCCDANDRNKHRTDCAVGGTRNRRCYSCLPGSCCACACCARCTGVCCAAGLFCTTGCDSAAADTGGAGGYFSLPLSWRTCVLNILILTNRSYLRRFSDCGFDQFVIVRFSGMEQCGYNSAAFGAQYWIICAGIAVWGARLLPSNWSSADLTHISPHARRSRPFRRGETQQHSCNQRSCHNTSVRLRLRRAERNWPSSFHCHTHSAAAAPGWEYAGFQKSHRNEIPGGFVRGTGEIRLKARPWRRSIGPLGTEVERTVWPLNAFEH